MAWEEQESGSASCADRVLMGGIIVNCGIMPSMMRVALKHILQSPEYLVELFV